MKLLKILFLAIFSFSAFGGTDLNLEVGAVSNPYNRVAIPGDDGTQFSLKDSFADSYGYHRLSLSHKFSEKHGVRLLYAPLRLSGSEVYSKDINFSGVDFQRNQKTYTEYQFNSYRASYFYQWLKTAQWDVRVGGTLKVRDAKVKLAQGDQSKVKRNSGLVPLFYFFSEYRWQNGLRLAFDFDGWAATQGRAFDGGLMGGYYFFDNLSWSLGYRVLEGGADNDNTLAFARLHYAFTSLQYSF